MCVGEGPDHISRVKVELVVCTYLLQDALSEVTKIYPTLELRASVCSYYSTTFGIRLATLEHDGLLVLSWTIPPSALLI